jgi:membrane protein YdbS with pleckstrin-like domain
MQVQQRHIFDNPRNVKRLLGVLYLLCVLLLAVDFIYHRHAEHPWEALWGFYGLYGFVACVSLVLIAKQLRRLLKRPEHYYDE